MNWTACTLFSLCAALTLSRAQDPNPTLPPPTRDLKFLVVVDSSYSMLSRRESTLGSVQGLVGSGFQGQIRPGDKFSVWTFNDEMDSGSFIPMTWDTDRVDFLAQEASLFAGSFGHKGRANFDLLFSELGRLPALTTNVLVVLFTDGAERFRGTPFDSMVNNAFEKEGLSLRAAARPFVISFCIQNGRYTKGMVFGGRGALRLPALPGQPPAPAKEVVAQAPEPAPAPKPQPVPKVERLRQQQPARTPVVLNFPPGADIMQDDEPSPIAPKPRPAALAQKTAPTTTTHLAQAASKPAPRPVSSNTTAAPKTTQKTAQKKSETNTTPVAVAKTTPPPSQKPPASSAPAAASVKPAPAQPPVARANTTDSFPSSTPIRSLTHSQLIWFGVGAASAALVVSVFFIFRGSRRKTGPSLISQSLGKH